MLATGQFNCMLLTVSAQAPFSCASVSISCRDYTNCGETPQPLPLAKNEIKKPYGLTFPPGRKKE